MIRCDSNGKWEIVGVVQRKQKDGSSSSLPKPKKQKPNRVLQPQFVKGVSVTTTAGCKNPKGKSVSSSSPSSTPSSTSSAAQERVEDDTSASETSGADRTAALSASSDGAPLASLPADSSENLVLEKGDEDTEGLPCIASVHSGNDPELIDLVSSPPRLVPHTSSGQPALPFELLKPGSSQCTSYVLNQPSWKAFGEYNDPVSVLIPGQNSHEASSKKSLNLASSSENSTTFRGTFKFDSTSAEASRGANSKIVFYPQQPAPKGGTCVKSILPKTTGPPNTSVSGGEKVKMLLVPSTTAPGKSLLIQTPSNDLPASYTLVFRKPDPIMTSAVSPASELAHSSANNFVLQPNSSVPLTFLTPALSKGAHSASTSTHPTQTTSHRFVNPSSAPPNVVSSNAAGVSNATFRGMKSPMAPFPNLLSSLKENCKATNVGNVVVGISSSSSNTSAITVTRPSFHQLRFTCSETSKGLISSPVVRSKKEDVVENTCPNEVSITPHQEATLDLKGLIVKRYGYCTAVDLSINFKSIKLLWLKGTIQKYALLNIFRMSRKNDAPITFTAKNNNVWSSFVALYRFYQDSGGQFYPVLILGKNLQSVLAMARLNARSLFMSNPIKYFIKDEAKLSSYTYDFKGLHLVKIEGRVKDGTSNFHFTNGKKVPVETVRETNIPGIEYPFGVQADKQSKSVQEEIVISDSDEDDDKRKKETDRDKSKTESTFNASSPVRSSKSVLVSPLADLSAATAKQAPEDRLGGVKTSEEAILNLLPPTLPVKRKHEESEEEVSQSSMKEEETSAQVKKLKTLDFSLGTSSASTSIPEEGKLEVEPLMKTVLKVPNPFNKKFCDGSNSSDEKNSVPCAPQNLPQISSPPPLKSPPKSPVKYVYPLKCPLRIPLCSSLTSPDSTPASAENPVSGQSMLKWTLVESPPPQGQPSPTPKAYKEPPSELLKAKDDKSVQEEVHESQDILDTLPKSQRSLEDASPTRGSATPPGDTDGGLTFDIGRGTPPPERSPKVVEGKEVLTPETLTAPSSGLDSNSNSSLSMQEEYIDVEGETEMNLVELLHEQLKEYVTTSRGKI